MTLSERQRIFARNVGQLIAFAYRSGYELTFGDAYRSPEQAAANALAGTGIANSLHTQRLAVDLNLFKDGLYLPASSSHTPLGAYWKSLHPDNCWGGDFRPKIDGNHYSMAHEGRK